MILIMRRLALKDAYIIGETEHGTIPIIIIIVTNGNWTDLKTPEKLK